MHRTPNTNKGLRSRTSNAIILYFLLHSFSFVCICRMEFKPTQYYRLYKTLCSTAGVRVCDYHTVVIEDHKYCNLNF